MHPRSGKSSEDVSSMRLLPHYTLAGNEAVIVEEYTGELTYNGQPITIERNTFGDGSVGNL